MNRLEILIHILYQTAKFFVSLMERDLGCVSKAKNRQAK